MIEYGNDRSPTMNPGRRRAAARPRRPTRRRPSAAGRRRRRPRCRWARRGCRGRRTVNRRCRGTSAASPCSGRTHPRRASPRAEHAPAPAGPPRVVRTPTTRPSSTTSSSKGDSSQSDACCFWTTTSKNAAARAAPMPGNSLAARDGAERAEDELRAAHETTRGRPGPAQQPDVVGLDRHGHRRLAGVPPRADPLDVEGLHLDGAADLAARQLGVVVGVVGGADQLHAVLLGGRDEVGDPVDERLLALPASWPAPRRRRWPPGR